LTPLDDQQLAGAVMWIPAGLVYLGAALGLLGAWFARMERSEQAQFKAAADLPALKTD
jgi:cytochrome c oxidase assembly factor CtaG